MQEAIHRSYIRCDSGVMPPCGQPKPPNVAPTSQPVSRTSSAAPPRPSPASRPAPRRRRPPAPGEALCRTADGRTSELLATTWSCLPSAPRCVCSVSTDGKGVTDGRRLLDHDGLDRLGVAVRPHRGDLGRDTVDAIAPVISRERLHPVYLDAATAAPLHPVARQALLAALDDGWADPARLYTPGPPGPPTARRGPRGHRADARRPRRRALLHPQRYARPRTPPCSAAWPAGAGSGATLVHSAIEHSAVLHAAERHVAAGGTAVVRTGGPARPARPGRLVGGGAPRPGWRWPR